MSAEDLRESSRNRFNPATLLSGPLRNSLFAIFLGLLIFYINRTGFFNLQLTIFVIVSLAILKCTYFIIVSYRKILEVSIKNTAYYEFMLFVVMHIFTIIISFATDFFCLLQVDSHSLKGIPLLSSVPEKIFDCFYFSVLNFSFFGYGDITPATIPAKLIMMFEAIISFFTVILVLSDFISLKDSIAEHRKKRPVSGKSSTQA